MNAPPPRPRPRAVSSAPAQPYPHASDFAPLSDEIPVDADPIPLESRVVPTMQGLSEQIGAVSSHLQVVHGEVALTRATAENAAASAQAAHAGVVELRKLVVGDHAPRLTEAEQAVREVEKRVPITIPPFARKGAALGGAAAIYPLLEWLVPVAQKWIESR